YNLVLKINKNVDVGPITELVKSHIEDAKLLAHSGDKLTYRLPLDSKELFPDMLFDLEKSKSDLLVHNVDIYVTSFESALIDFAEPADYVADDKTLNELHLEQMNDFQIFQLTQQQIRDKWMHVGQQIVGLFYKRWCFVYHRRKLLLPQMIVPVVMITFVVYSNMMAPGLIHAHQLLAITILDSHLVTANSTNDQLVFANSSDPEFTTRIASIQMLLFLKNIFLSILIPLCLSVIACSFIIFPVEERVTQFKKLQLMSGVGRFYFWLVSFVWDFAIYCFCVSFVILILAMEDGVGLLKESSQSATIIAIFLLNGWASIPFAYVLSFMSSNSTASYLNLLNSMLMTNIIFPAVVLFSSLSTFQLISAVGWILSWLFRLFPNFCCAMSLIKITIIALDSCRFIHPDTLSHMCAFAQLPEQVYRCCQEAISKEDEILSSGVVEDMLALAACGVLYLLCVWLHEVDSKDKSLSLLSRVQSWLWFISRETIETDILTIAAYSNRAVHLDRVYRRTAGLELLKSISLSVKCGESVGLLGASRYCKTSLLKMIAGLEQVDQGKITIFDSTFDSNPKKYSSQIGYCPQTSLLMDSFTAREVLFIFCMLKGVIDVELVVEDLIAVFQLEEERHQLITHYE
uniref:Uncharacterized protein n=1 Tax=Strigamia maritima TaxID=126957 RepID=T1JGN3_STRMM